MADFRQFYGLRLADVWTGALGIREVILLSGQLLSIPDSRYLAELEGGPQFSGWDHDRALLADIRDLLLAIASGLSGSKLTDQELYPRPQQDVEPLEPATIAEFDVSAFMQQLIT